MRDMTPFELEFYDYSRIFENYTVLLQDENVPRELRLFDIRFRLAIDLVVDYKGEVSYTRTTIIKQNYAQLMKLMELWNCYEALTKYLDTIGMARHGKPKYEQISVALIHNAKIDNLDEQCFSQIKDLYIVDQKFRHNYDEYIRRIQNGFRERLAECCSGSIAFFRNEQSLSGYELFALIYAERNLFYHNGESAKLGMDYQRRNKLLSLYYDNFTLCLLRIIQFVISQQIDILKS